MIWVTKYRYKVLRYTHPWFCDFDRLVEADEAQKALSLFAHDGVKVISVVVLVGFPTPCTGFMDLIASDQRIRTMVRAHAMRLNMMNSVESSSQKTWTKFWSRCIVAYQ